MPRSRIRRGQDEIFKRCAAGSYDSSPIGPSPSSLERHHRDAFQTLGPLEHPSLFFRHNKCRDREMRIRRIQVHAAKRAATVASILQIFEV
jgi:hypothetical protein